jgi:hypothetical protein
VPKFDTSFNFGYNVKPKKAKSAGGKKKGGKRQLSSAQKATAALYMKPRGRR